MHSVQMAFSVRSVEIREDAAARLGLVRARCRNPPLVTVAAIVAVLVTALRFHVFSRELPLDLALRYGFSVRALTQGHWGTVITSQFLSRDPFMAVSIAASLALMLGVYEMMAGSARASMVMAVTATAGPLIVGGGIGIGSALGSRFAGQTMSTLDYGASAITAGGGGALVAVAGGRKLRWFAILWVIGGLLLHHQLADWEHLASFSVGYGLAVLLGTPATSLTSRLRAVRWNARVPAVAVAALVLVSVVVGVEVGGTVIQPRATPRLQLTIRQTRLGQKSQPSRAVAASPAQVIPVDYPAPSLGRTHHALLILPVGYSSGLRRYPVIEMLHGSPGSPADIVTGLDPLAVPVSPFIGVIPDGHGPVVSAVAFADTSRQHLGTAVSDDLRAWIDNHYRTDGHWSVAGLSEGGYGAAYLGSRTPGQYDSVCSMSGNFTPEGTAFTHESLATREAATPLLHSRPDGPRTLLIAGAADLPSVREILRYAQALHAGGQKYQSVVVPGGHTWGVWHSAFPRCLKFMLGTTHHRNRPHHAQEVTHVNSAAR